MWLRANACNSDGMIPGWFDRMRALKTARYPMMQGGLGLVLFAVTANVLVILFGGRKTSDWRTPEKRSTYFILGLALLAVSLFAQLVSLRIDLGRGEFPHCADTIMIPAGALVTAYAIMTLVCVVIGAILATGMKHLPAPLWARDRAKPLQILIDFIATLLVLALLFTTYGIARSSAFIAVPTGVVAIYLVLATRAGLSAKQSLGDSDDTDEIAQIF